MSDKFDELVAVMRRLRAPGGCPWDREQTYGSLAQYLLEEAYETFDAIQETEETGDVRHLREELGDLLLQVVFHCVIAEEKGDFTLEDVAGGIAQKLILRHPHVFGETKLETAADVISNWEALKANERKASGAAAKDGGLLEEVPVHFPALLEALKLTKKAAKVRFDWENTDEIFEKLDEEIRELKEAISENSNIEEEIGDLMFVMANLARRLDIEPETALKKANRKFRRRFSIIEETLASRNKDLTESTPEEMNAIWNDAKLAE